MVQMLQDLYKADEFDNFVQSTPYLIMALIPLLRGEYYYIKVHSNGHTDYFFGGYWHRDIHKQNGFPREAFKALRHANIDTQEIYGISVYGLLRTRGRSPQGGVLAVYFSSNEELYGYIRQGYLLYAKGAEHRELFQKLHNFMTRGVHLKPITKLGVAYGYAVFLEKEKDPASQQFLLKLLEEKLTKLNGKSAVWEVYRATNYGWGWGFVAITKLGNVIGTIISNITEVRKGSLLFVEGTCGKEVLNMAYKGKYIIGEIVDDLLSKIPTKYYAKSPTEETIAKSLKEIAKSFRKLYEEEEELFGEE